MIQHMASDDWNRTRGEGTEYEIKCDSCRKKYHIAQSGYHYLVPNGIEMPHGKRRRSFYSFYSTVKEEIACSFSQHTLQEVLSDMKANKYSTRLTNDVSKHIVSMYYRRKKRRNLPEIILCLEEIVKNYNNYEWNSDKIKEYRKQEEKEIEDNEAKIDAVIKVSFKLNF